ncbi:MAG TPA: Asp-tRNA(Asn)/Glu-tRNA(Gln) amidotransferase subunit GatA [Deltaproteobacteria bacterium]|nr:Asp-tRNA(Asn)/Glu-tRNA(Gln) amidotransferase subunit GatA [Deltaproteobacteria bacterium]
MLDTARRYREGKTSPTQEVEALFARIGEDTLNAFVTLDRQGALTSAARAGIAIGRGNDDPLLGIPIAVKDNICTRGIRTTCSSEILKRFIPTYDAHVIGRLKAKGAVILGKTNLDEFAMGSTTTTSAFGPTRNPWDETRTPGGSSGGSAAAVAAGLCTAALGSDTGGSVRQPASFCGITGLKPTYGTVSRYGLVAFASSLDQIGPMGRTARDVAMVYDAVKGHDRRDSTSVPRAFPATPLGGLDLQGVRIGVPGVFFSQGLAPDVERAVRKGIERFRDLGAAIVEVDLPHIRYGVAVYYLIAPAEASSNLARYDGVRYGERFGDEKDLFAMYRETRARGFGSEVKRRIMLGTYALCAGYYDAYYRKASQVRTLIIEDFRKAFTCCDIIAGPTVPITAFGLAEKVDDPLSLYLLDIYTIPANLAGLPAISIPCGFGDDGMPVGLQLMAPAFQDDVILRAGIAFQDSTHFHEVRP